MRRVDKVRCGCACAAALAAAAQLQAATGAFTENTKYTTFGRAPGAPADTAHAPYGWIGYNGAKTWELYRKYEPNSYQDPGGDITMDQNGVTIANDSAQITHAIVHNETSNFSMGGSWNGPGLWIGPNGVNQFPTNSQVLVANPVMAGTPQNMEIRIGFITTADLANFIYNPAAGVGSASDGGDGRSATQNGGTRRTSHSDFYGGANPGPGADTYYLHVAVDPTGTISGINGYARSGDNMNQESAATALVNPADGSSLVTATGNVGPGPYAISAQLVKSASSPTGWSFVEHIGGWTGTYDLPDLSMDPSGTAFHAGTFDPTKVTPAIYAQMAGGSDYADADIYATIPGDANLDGKVNFTDLVTLAAHYGQQDVGWVGGNFTGSGTVGFADLVLLAAHYGQGPTAAFAQVPEPVTLALLVPAALALLPRRRRQR